MGTKLLVAVSFAWMLAGCGGSTDSDAKGNTGGTSSGGTSSGGTSSGGSGGTATGGTSSGGSSGDAGVKYCGGLAGVMCGEGEFCNYGPDCGGDDSQGVCETKPEGCYEDCPGVCGCDGKFYCNACIAHAAGVDDSTSVLCVSDADAGIKKCGGSGGAACAQDEYCQFADGCGAPGSEGVCKDKPQACDADCPGVCGCDGKFYCNECNANAMGVAKSNDLSCLGGDGGVGTGCSNSNECKAGLLCCYPCGVQGCSNQCTAPDPSGNCPAFP